MRLALTAVALLVVAAVGASAQEAVYLDQLMETPAARLQERFEGLKKEECYRLAENRFVMISIDKKDQKPWRVVVSQAEPCRRPHDISGFDVRERRGIELGDSAADVVRKAGPPDTAARADADMRKFGEMEYFYICRVDEGCARHTSVFLTGGVVTAFGEWYSE